MKTKIPVLIAAALFLAIASRAQYGGVYPVSHVAIQGQIIIPGKVAVGYAYNNRPVERYPDRRDWKGYRVKRKDIRYIDWREVEYERYCREHRNYRVMSREQFYRERCAH